MANVPVLTLRTHAQRVCSLYKRALRNLESYYDHRHVFRYQAVLLRARFDENAKVRDMRRAALLLRDGEEELFSLQHPIPKKFAKSPGGVASERVVDPPDWVLDYWHPEEKALYPEYFRRRELRKKEYLALWEKEFSAKGEGKDEKH